ncbi:MAG: hypothetical protein WAQ12_04275 [Tissierellaceae bacterium]|jgi:hypothetical protein|nr:hypothetical protein [Tissierellia bacterium]
MVDELINLCEHIITALRELREKELIDENELEIHLEKKLLFIDDFK